MSGSALTAERVRMDVIANNIANMNTTRTPGGGPYQRQQVVFTPQKTDSIFQISSTGGRLDTGRGVRVQAILEDAQPGLTAYEPAHPDADANGYVTYPNVDVNTELVDMLAARRAYEANVVVINATKVMVNQALEIGRV
ncbi:MAG: flagellar basal body rod protein FlgC [Chloroflexi bacterium RBG_16_57_9]|nr:MAG: flagellar basal body rod protein FlgC [Chloroflexi bacterium RBG_16_57_9]